MKMFFFLWKGFAIASVFWLLTADRIWTVSHSFNKCQNDEHMVRCLSLLHISFYWQPMFFFFFCKIPVIIIIMWMFHAWNQQSALFDSCFFSARRLLIFMRFESHPMRKYLIKASAYSIAVGKTVMNLRFSYCSVLFECLLL